MTHNPTFNEQLSSLGLTFRMPEGYEEVAVKENRDLTYTYALYNSALDIEIRYSIFPLKHLVDLHKQSQQSEGMVVIDPNQIFFGRLETNAMNMTHGEWYEPVGAPAEFVEEGLGADQAVFCFFHVNCGFGEGYKHGQFLGIHKDDVADVIVTMLSNDENHIKPEHAPILSLSFK